MGSGPFIFRREEWRPGDRAVFDRNRHYRPREEPADGLAGGKVVHVEQRGVRQPSGPRHDACHALLAGEVDFSGIRAAGLRRACCARDRNIVVASPRPPRPDHGRADHRSTNQPPFDNPWSAGRCSWRSTSDEIVAGLGLPRRHEPRAVPSRSSCAAARTKPTRARRRRCGAERREGAGELLREAGYAGERAVLLHSVDSALINPMALVLIDRMRRAGFNLDVAATDFSSLAQRRLNRRAGGARGLERRAGGLERARTSPTRWPTTPPRTTAAPTTRAATAIPS